MLPPTTEQYEGYLEENVEHFRAEARALREQRGALADALSALVTRYNALGSFISCITPPHRGPHVSAFDRAAAAKNEVWAEWDAAVAALKLAGRLP